MIDENRKRQYSRTNVADIPLKERVFSRLNKYPNISPKELCKLLGIDYDQYKGTIRTYKYEYRKHQLKNRQVLKSLTYHNVRYFGYAIASVDRDAAVGVGWKTTKARNRMIVWKNKLGRIEWFETGRVNAWVKKPATLGKMKQLLADAFFKTGLIFDINWFTKWAEHFKLKGFHLVLDTGEHLPYARLSNLKSDTGVVAVIGDSSHRTGLELQVFLPDWREKQELLQELTLKQLNSFSEFMKGLTTPKALRKDASGMIV